MLSLKIDEPNFENATTYLGNLVGNLPIRDETNVFPSVTFRCNRLRKILHTNSSYKPTVIKLLTMTRASEALHSK